MYLTGGIGAAGGHEGFGTPYELPNMQAYNETCASVGMDYWNHRLFLLHGDAKYIDVMERTLYNGLISGVSLDGKTFFYPNPLESNGQHARSEWFGVACCPGNITRFMASVPGYLYATKGNDVYVNLYAGGTADIDTPGGKLKVVQATRYPWDSAVKMTLTPDKARRFAVNVRIPGWVRNEPVPSDLYRFLDNSTEAATISVNRVTVPMQLSNGYVTIDREWSPGDAIELNLPMPVRRVLAHPNVEADRDRVALQRGPIVYAAEWPDNNGATRNIVLPDSSRLGTEFRPALLNGVQVITGRSVALAKTQDGGIEKKEQDFVAIPYATWANRGRGQMNVWLARTEAAARPTPFPTVATTSTVRASTPPSGRGKNPRPIIDGEEPRNSAETGSYFDWWPVQGWHQQCGQTEPGGQRRPCSKGEWIEMIFATPANVSQTGIYWFDDEATRGGVRVPASWRLLYKDGDEWKPVETTDPFGTAKDRWNTVAFTPVNTTALRLEVVLQPGQSAGLQEWKAK